jgi:hypothetical protein
VKSFSSTTKSKKVKFFHCKQQKARMEEEVQALVIDNGSGMCKAGTTTINA